MTAYIPPTIRPAAGIVLILAIATASIFFQKTSQTPLLANMVFPPTPTIVTTPVPARPTHSPTPSKTPSPYPSIQPSVTATQPTTTPTATVTPSPAPDTIGPFFSSLGPPNGGTISDNHFCLSVYDISDNASHINEIYFKYLLDDKETDWTQNESQCYENLSDGIHYTQVTGKDKAGNIVRDTRSFTIQAAQPQIPKPT